MNAQQNTHDCETETQRIMLERLESNGVIDLYFSRHDYHERLDEYIDRAQRRIDAVTTTFRLASQQGDLCAVLKRKLQLEDFQIRLSLLRPKSTAAELMSMQMGQSLTDFNRSVESATDLLLELRNSLSEEQKSRFHLLQHDSLPFGTAYMIDANISSGMIHVETKLFYAPGKESFGYRIVGPSDFFQRNYQAWMEIIARSMPL